MKQIGGGGGTDDSVLLVKLSWAVNSEGITKRLLARAMNQVDGGASFVLGKNRMG